MSRAKSCQFGLFVHLLLKAKRKKQIDAAAHLGILPSGFSKKMNGRVPWTLDECFMVLGFLDVSFADFLAFSPHGVSHIFDPSEDSRRDSTPGADN